VGKKQSAGQRHDRDFAGQLNGVLHRSFVRFAHGNEYTRGLSSEMTTTIEANDFASERDNFRSTFGATANPVVLRFAPCRSARS
jgi:Ca2+-binding RTX toxin-like protein